MTRREDIAGRLASDAIAGTTADLVAFGGSLLEDLRGITESAYQIRDQVGVGRMSTADARAALNRLRDEHGRLSEQRNTFETRADRVTEMESDPLAYGIDLLDRTPALDTSEDP